MKVPHKILLILIILSLIFAEIKSESSKDYALQIAKILSSKEYMGRQSGTIENEKSVNLIKEEIMKIGISPSQIFIQEFPLDVYILDEIPKLEVYYKKNVIWKGKYRRNFKDVFIGSAKIFGEIKYVNYGLKIDDYYGSEGKISISRLGYENPKDKNLDRIDHRVSLANLNSSIGLILILDETRKYIIAQKSLFLNKFPIPVIYLSNDSWNIIKSYYNKNLSLWISYFINYKIKREISKNLFLLYPGKEEKYIIISAHLDHVGKDPDGSYFPGANDNASGIGVLLETIKILRERDIKPKYNIVFTFFNAEEYGLKGSEFYIKNPIFPLDKTVLNINLDCLGRGKYLYLVYNYISENYVNKLRKINKTLIPLGEHILLTQSDQYNFVKIDIPSIFITRADEDLSIPDLHQKVDNSSKISYQNLWEVIDLLIKFIEGSE